jgi:hypothetical protein
MKPRKVPSASAPVSVLRPMDVERRYNITAPTRWRWEKSGVLPPRDVYRGRKAWGWYETTLAASERGPI